MVGEVYEHTILGMYGGGGAGGGGQARGGGGGGGGGRGGGGVGGGGGGGENEASATDTTILSCLQYAAFLDGLQPHSCLSDSWENHFKYVYCTVPL